ncbi:MAG: hypothetical protein DMG74_16025 [Acidobacteria bacterium]|nr:MAG: hypothetical protein DMG74_16025 [Acidobacteriota bacterium]
MRAVSALLLILPVVAVTQPVPTNRSLTTQHLQSTLFVNCPGSEKPKRLLSPVSFSEDRKWRAYVQVDVQPACVYTTRLWVARANGAYRLIYLMPPQRDASENGMEILGWAKKSRMLLLMTEQCNMDPMPQTGNKCSLLMRDPAWYTSPTWKQCSKNARAASNAGSV